MKTTNFILVILIFAFNRSMSMMIPSEETMMKQKAQQYLKKIKDIENPESSLKEDALKEYLQERSFCAKVLLQGYNAEEAQKECIFLNPQGTLGLSYLFLPKDGKYYFAEAVFEHTNYCMCKKLGCYPEEEKNIEELSCNSSLIRVPKEEYSKRADEIFSSEALHRLLLQNSYDFAEAVIGELNNN